MMGHGPDCWCRTCMGDAGTVPVAAEAPRPAWPPVLVIPEDTRHIRGCIDMERDGMLVVGANPYLPYETRGVPAQAGGGR